MKLAVIKLQHGFKPSLAELTALQEAIIHCNTDNIVMEDGMVKSWEFLLVDIQKLPDINYEVIKQIRLDTSFRPPSPSVGGTVLNQKISVALPGLGLLAINDVQVAEDCCTNGLQDYLNDGWRILAICPQPDQRRPDYILGRYLEGGSDRSEFFDNPRPWPKNKLTTEETSVGTEVKILVDADLSEHELRVAASLNTAVPPPHIEPPLQVPPEFEDDIPF